jgi:hypothetical protein
VGDALAVGGELLLLRSARGHSAQGC